jgi:hypothetical protein
LKDHARRAETALKGAVLHKCFLEWMKLSFICKAFDRDYFFPRDVLYRVLAGSHSFFVDNYSACATLAVAAAEFGSRKPQIRAQYPEERSLTIRGDAYGTIVQLETNRLLHSRSFFRL